MLWCKYLGKFNHDNLLSKHIYFLSNSMGLGVKLYRLVKYQCISQRTYFTRHCLENLPNMCIVTNDKWCSISFLVLGCKFSANLIFHLACVKYWWFKYSHSIWLCFFHSNWSTYVVAETGLGRGGHKYINKYCLVGCLKLWEFNKLLDTLFKN